MVRAGDASASASAPLGFLGETSFQSQPSEDSHFACSVRLRTASRRCHTRLPLCYWRWIGIAVRLCLGNDSSFPLWLLDIAKSMRPWPRFCAATVLMFFATRRHTRKFLGRTRPEQGNAHFSLDRVRRPYKVALRFHPWAGAIAVQCQRNQLNRMSMLQTRRTISYPDVPTIPKETQLWLSSRAPSRGITCEPC